MSPKNVNGDQIAGLRVDFAVTRTVFNPLFERDDMLGGGGGFLWPRTWVLFAKLGSCNGHRSGRIHLQVPRKRGVNNLILG